MTLPSKLRHFNLESVGTRCTPILLYAPAGLGTPAMPHWQSAFLVDQNCHHKSGSCLVQETEEEQGFIALCFPVLCLVLINLPFLLSGHSRLNRPTAHVSNRLRAHCSLTLIRRRAHSPLLGLSPSS